MSVHDGHRERVKERFREQGLDGFNDINALELLLYYAIPRRDTNELAHELLKTFGSLDEVLNASEQELCAVPGMGVNAACLLRLVPQMMRKSAISRTKDMKQIPNARAAGRYLIPRFMNERVESALLLSLDAQKRLIACDEVGRGVPNATEVSIRRIVELALKRRASSVILAHNHPDGELKPSRDDDRMTGLAAQALEAVHITLDDHIIVSGDQYLSYRETGGLMMLRAAL